LLLLLLDIVKIEYNSYTQNSSSYTNEKENFQKKIDDNLTKREEILSEYTVNIYIYIYSVINIIFIY